MHPLANLETIASEFVCILNDWLTDYEMDLIRNYNAMSLYAERDMAFSCASHNFCDANMAMLTAFEVITECDYDLDNQAHVDLFNDAWDYAKVNHLTKKD